MGKQENEWRCKVSVPLSREEKDRRFEMGNEIMRVAHQELNSPYCDMDKVTLLFDEYNYLTTNSELNIDHYSVSNAISNIFR